MDNRNHAILAHFFLTALAYVFLVMDDEWTQFYVLFGIMFFQALGIIYDSFSPGRFDHFTLPRYLLHPYEPYYSRLARDAIAFGEEPIYVFDIIIFAIYGELEQQDQQQQQVFEEKKESLWEQERREKEELQQEIERNIITPERAFGRARGIVEDREWTNKWEEYEAKKARERKQSETAKASQSDQSFEKKKPKRKSGFGDPFEVDNGGPFEEDKNGRPIIPDWYVAEHKEKASAAAAAKAEEERKQAEMAEKKEQAKIAAKLAAKKLQEDKAVADFKKTFGASSNTYVAWQCHYCNIHHHAIWAERAGHVRLFGKEPEPVIKTIFGNHKAMYCTCCGWPYNQPGQPVNHGFTAVAPSQNGGAAVVQP
ncbi:hypothetical protein KC331_g15395, partial [Hortaea werneckii]